jgi:hypothetical protein
MKAATFAVHATFALISIGALAQTPSPPGAPIENVCNNVAGQSETQRQTCVRQEQQSRENLDSAKADPAVRKFCRDTVGEAAELQNACIQQENLAKARIDTMTVDAAVKQRCESTAAGSYVKLRACIEKEAVGP